MLGVSLAANLIIVVWEFNSFRAALTILIAIPFSMVGAILGLFLTHQPSGKEPDRRAPGQDERLGRGFS